MVASFEIFDAAHQGDLERLQQIIDDGVDVNGHPPAWKSAYQPTALGYAVWGNQPEAVKLLLEAGADPDKADGDDNYHPLHWASYKSDHAECAQLLIDFGADPGVVSAAGFTPLQMAHGDNAVVSSKPGVAAVLEEALRNPRPRFRGRPSADTPADIGSSSSSSLTTAAVGSASAAAGSSSSAASPDAAPARPRVPSSGSGTWSPLEAAALAAEAAAAARRENALHEEPSPGGARAQDGDEAGGAPAAAAAAEAADADIRAVLEELDYPPALEDLADLQRERRQPGATAPPRPRVQQPEEPPEDAAERRSGAGSGSGSRWTTLEGALKEALAWGRALVPALGCAALALGIGWHANLAAGDRPLHSVIVLLTGLVMVLCALLLRQRRRGAGPSMHRVTSLPPQFLCPITNELMLEPVTTSDGHVFERDAIERWLATHSTSPMTGMPLEHTNLAPAHALRQLIETTVAKE